MQVDPVAFKEAARTAWERSAAGWDAHTPAIHRWLAAATETMLDLAAVGPGSRVLDVAAGAGDQTLAIARRVGPTGRVLANDLSPALLALARSRCRKAGFDGVETMAGDAESLRLEQESFDAAVCRLGLMLFPRPAHALHAMRQALVSGGRACSLVFGRPDRNPCVAVLMKTAVAHAGVPMPDPGRPGGLFSLGMPGALERIYEEAGFREIAVSVVDAPFELPSAGHYIDFIRSSASPIQQILAPLDAGRQQAAWDDMRERLEIFRDGDRWVGPNELLLVSARR